MALDEVKNKGILLTKKKSNLNNKSAIKTIKEWAEIIVVALIFTIFFKTFFYEMFTVPSESMNPLLLPGDRVLVNKYYYGYSKHSVSLLPIFCDAIPLYKIPFNGRILDRRKPQRGDVIVFKTKESARTGIFYIKRIIGLPGDIIQVKNNQLYVNDKKFDYQEAGVIDAKSGDNHNNFPVMKYIENNNKRNYEIFIADINSIAGNTAKYVVPQDHYFCMGDNRDNSHDCRFPDFGFVPYENIVGRAEIITFSTANGILNFPRFFKNIQASYNEN